MQPPGRGGAKGAFGPAAAPGGGRWTAPVFRLAAWHPGPCQTKVATGFGGLQGAEKGETPNPELGPSQAWVSSGPGGSGAPRAGDRGRPRGVCGAQSAHGGRGGLPARRCVRIRDRVRVTAWKAEDAGRPLPMLRGVAQQTPEVAGSRADPHHATHIQRHPRGEGGEARPAPHADEVSAPISSRPWPQTTRTSVFGQKSARFYIRR